MSTNKGIADSIRHFTPAWFAVNMGTGAVSILFSGFPYGDQNGICRMLSAVFFFLNLLLFVLFFAATIARYTRFPATWSVMIRHPNESLSLGTFPMGAATLIGVGTTLLHGRYGFGGRTFVYTLWGLWWIDVALSILCCWGVIYAMITKQSHSLQEMTTVWLLPIVTLIVASSVGAELAQALHPYSAASALTTLAFTISSVSIGLTLSFMILTIYLHRLIVYDFPPGLSIVSSFIPLGPMGQAGFSVLIIGQAMRDFLPTPGNTSLFLGNAQTGEIIFALCVCMGFVLWALATMWLGYALLGMQYVVRRTQVPFKLSFWGMVFPNGVYANLTVALYQVLDVQFFRVWGAIYSSFTVLIWIVMFYRTAVLVPHGRIFEAPCLRNIEEDTSPCQTLEREYGKDDRHSPMADKIPVLNSSV